MSTPYNYMLASVVTPGGQISQIVDQNIDPGIQEMIESGSGTPDTEFVAIGEAKPMMGFTSTAIAQALGICGLSAYAITSATDFYLQKIDQGGVRASGNSHIKLTMTKGLLVPRSLDASQGKDPAKISYDLYAISTDGTTAPIAIAVSQALPTIDPVSQLFTVGPVKINGSALAGIQSLKWDLQMKEECIASDGEVYPTFAGITTRQPRCGINGLDLTALNTFGITGLALTSFSTYFTKIARNGTRVANGTAEHIKISGVDGMLIPRGAKGSNQKPMEGEWSIVPAYAGSSAIVAISTGSAIV